MATGTTSSLINRAIASLFNGVSQQPSALRLPSQCEVQNNGYAALVDGLIKRPPAKHLAKLSTDVLENSYVHYINRDANERYVLVIKDGTAQVYDLDGVSMTMVWTASSSYLDVTGDPRDAFSVVTVADYTFIVNKEVTVAMDSAVTGNTDAGHVQDFSSLPGSPTNNDVYEIQGDPNNAFDGYYVKWNNSEGVWVECPKVGIEYQIDPLTMPHSLTRTAVDEFTFDVVSWGERGVGDLTSSPDPSFVGRTVNDIFFHRNRLGLLAGDNIILSTSPASAFSFFRNSATVLVDSDPIDTAASHTKVSTLYHAVPFDKSLLLISEQTQFILSGTTVLTPATATINVTTEFEASVSAKPVGAGANLYFPVPKGNYSGIREYFVEDEVTTNDAADITAHVPTYLAQDIFQLEASSNEDALLALSAVERNKMWVYKYFWQGDEKVQSSWSVWEFDADDVIMGVGFIETDIYVTVKRSDGTYLEKISLESGLEDTDMGFQVLLDQREELTGSYDAGNDWTTWTTANLHGDDRKVILGGDFANQIGQAIGGVTYPTTTTVRKAGDYSAGICYVGKPYTFEYKFSEQFLRDANKNAIREGRLMMRTMAVNYTDSGYFKVTVEPEHRDINEYEFTGKILGGGNFLLGVLQIISGSFQFPIMADSRGVVITITNDSHLPSIFQSAEWNALYHGKATR